MKYWKELPFRGDGESRGSKPRKRFRNKKRERRELAISIFVLLMLGIGIFGCFAFSPDMNNSSKTAGFVIIAFFISSLIIGVLSTSKFRKGYDIDISDESEKEKDNQSKDSND